MYNYTEVEAKIRDATNLDSWGPTGTQMNEIAQMTYNRCVNPARHAPAQPFFLLGEHMSKSPSGGLRALIRCVPEANVFAHQVGDEA